MVRDALADWLTFDAALMPVGSPNSMQVPITAANIASNRANYAYSTAALTASHIPVIPWTVMPVVSSLKDWNSSDSLRRELNSAWRNAVTSGQILMDFDTVASDELDGDGQMSAKTGFMKDGIHPNDTGNAMLVSLVKKAIKLTTGTISGSLIVS